MRRSIVYSDPLNDDFANNGIKKKPLPENYRYLPKGAAGRGAAFVLHHFVAVPIVFACQKLCYREHIVNRRALKPYLSDGVFLYGNHTRGAGDAFCPSLAAFPRRPYIVTNSDSVSNPVLRPLVRALGGLPLPDTVTGLARYRRMIDSLSARGECVVIYPEAHIWPLYIDIRPFPDASFRYPAETGKPVFAFTSTYKKRGFLPLVKSTVYIDGPFFGDARLSVRENQKNLRDSVYNAMKKRSKASVYSYHSYVPAPETDLDRRAED